MRTLATRPACARHFTSDARVARGPHVASLHAQVAPVHTLASCAASRPGRAGARARSCTGSRAQRSRGHKGPTNVVDSRTLTPACDDNCGHVHGPRDALEHPNGATCFSVAPELAEAQRT